MRQFFWARSFLEVETPTLITAPAPEENIEALKVNYTLPNKGLRQNATGANVIKPMQSRYLQTSPELAMKRLVASGAHNIFQLAAVFRDQDHSLIHRPEFRLLEWYRAHAALPQLMDDVEDLFKTLQAALASVWPQDLPAPHHLKALCHTPFARIRVADAFVQHAGFDILDYLTEDTLRHKLVAQKLHCRADDTWADLFYRVFLSHVEPKLLAQKEPFFLLDYPSPMAMLAQINKGDPRICERFEFYAGGMEIANAFLELVDADEQRRRFEAARLKRRKKDLHDYPIDETFLQALQAMPPTSGIALGWERLLMLMLDGVSIDDVAFIAWDDA